MGLAARCAALAAAAALLAPAALVSAWAPISNETMRGIPRPGKDFDIHEGKLLAPILIPRVPGTEGIVKVRQHFLDFFKNDLPEWEVEMHNSTQMTPLKGGTSIEFVNLIMKRAPPDVDPGDVEYLTLAAHYDSLHDPEGFIGATDSAAPCAMLLHVARSVDAALTKKWAAEGSGDTAGGTVAPRGVQLILFDGEEAFQKWTDTDSIYGARALAESWEGTVHPFYSTFRNPLDQISLMVLLDLLGVENPEVPSYFKTTHWAYRHMADAEKRLRDLDLIKSRAPDKKPKDTPFLLEGNKPDGGHWLGGYIGDDHTPFLARGVEILHLIPHPFPWLWHKGDDNGDNLDFETTNDWAVITTAFVAEWMELETYMEQKSADEESKEKEHENENEKPAPPPPTKRQPGKHTRDELHARPQRAPGHTQSKRHRRKKR